MTSKRSSPAASSDLKVLLKLILLQNLLLSLKKMMTILILLQNVKDQRMSLKKTMTILILLQILLLQKAKNQRLFKKMLVFIIQVVMYLDLGD